MVTTNPKDLSWCRLQFKKFPNVYFTGDAYPSELGPSHTGMDTVAYDMATMARCNHTIYDYGTYGFWCAFLAGGRTIHAHGYCPKHLFFDKLFEETTKLLPGWKTMHARDYRLKY